MAIRNTTHVLKKSLVPGQTLPSSGILQGEPLVNLGDGILYFTGGTSGVPTWVDSGNATAGYFEVGSNLYQLKIRDKITSYSGVTNLAGKFLSGTSTGFVLANISDINGISGFTYLPSSNTFRITDASGDIYDATFQSVTGLTVNGDLVVTGTTSLSGLSLYDETVSGTNPLEITNVAYVTGISQSLDVYVTGSTYNGATNSTNTATHTLLYKGTPSGGPYTLNGKDTFTTGGTYDNNTTTITFDKNDGTNFTVDLSTIDVNDTYVTGGTNNAATTNSPSASISLLYNQDVAPATYSLPYTDVFTTGFTYNSTTNTFTIKDNSGNTFNQSFDTVSGLTVSNLTSGRVVYVGTNGLLKDESVFTYTEGSNTLGVENIDASGDVVIQGSLTVFGPSVSAFTSNLYVEDPNITLNYNPTGNTTVTSVNAGITIQDGNGVASGDVKLDIVRMQNLTGLTATEIPSVVEYTSLTGYANRGWVTQLNDIVIRSTDPTDDGLFNGVRVLAEFDVLDGGTY